MTDVQITGPRRRPSAGGYARGEETREKMILAAMRVFAEEGFDKASTRQIAARAGVTPPVLQYHFDSKEGLHRACGEYLVAKVIGTVAPILERGRQVLQGSDPEAAVDVLCELVLALAGARMGEPDVDEWRLFLTRADMDSGGPAREVCERGISEPLIGMTIALVARALDLDPAGDEAKLRAAFLTSQVMLLTAKRQRTLAIMGWDVFDDDAQARVKSVLEDHIRRLVRRG